MTDSYVTHSTGGTEWQREDGRLSRGWLPGFWLRQMQRQGTESESGEGRTRGNVDMPNSTCCGCPHTEDAVA